MFGDMVYRFSLLLGRRVVPAGVSVANDCRHNTAADAKIYQAHFVMPIPCRPHAVGQRCPKTHTLAAERLAHANQLPAKARVACGRDLTHDVVRREIQFGQLFRKAPRTDCVAADRRRHVQCLMRSLEVINLTPRIETLLAIWQARERPTTQNFGIERAMKTLLFPLRLRMVRPPMRHADVQPQQPQSEPGVRFLEAPGPRTAVVHEHALRQPIAAKNGRQLRLHRLALFVRARRQAKREPRMIVEDRQRMAALARAQSEVTLEVHLPQLVRRRTLETFPRLMFLALVGIDLAMPRQDRLHRARRGQLPLPQRLQPRPQLAGAPGRMFVSQRNNRLLDLRGRPSRRLMRPPRPIDQSLRAFLAKPLEPLIAGHPTNPKLPAQLRVIRTFPSSQRTKLPPLRHGRFHLPGHNGAPFGTPSSPAKKVLTMSPNVC